MAGRAEDGLDGFVRLYDDEYDRIARTVYLVLHDSGRAEEVTQEAFVRLYVHWGRVRREGHAAPGPPRARPPSAGGGHRCPLTS